MEYILSLLKEISIENHIEIYIVDGYLVDKVLNRETKNIKILVKGNKKELVNILSNSTEKIKLTDGNISYNDIELNIESINKNIEEELLDRHFTIEAVAIDIKDYMDLNKIIDPLDGLKDIKNNIIKHTSKKLLKNPINLLRAIKLMAKYRFKLCDKTKNIIINNKILLTNICSKDIGEEVLNILSYKDSYYYFRYMEYELNILEFIFPEIETMRDVGECKYHVVDALTHSIYTLKTVENIIYTDGYFEKHIREEYEKYSQKRVYKNHSRLQLIKLAAFFHDVGKPAARWVDETGRTRFRGHEKVGADMIKDIAIRFGLSKKEQDILYNIVLHHMIPLVLYKKNDLSNKNLIEAFNKMESETLDILLIALADIIATRKLLNPEEPMEKFKIHIEYIVSNYLTRYKNR
ncbi:HD domain-containing protein [Dethiothermospora halolimnae]|uniref:HD domain-containing protein n=1 Tax=Dethiothermospora halolimnae TaxID=3114390 RepID=UPI003CCBD50B